MKHGDLELRMALLGLAFLILAAAWRAYAEPGPVMHRIQFENPGPGSTSSLLVCWLDGCTDYAVPCGEGERCEVEASLSYGCGMLEIATVQGDVQSEPSGRLYCAAGYERYDMNGDGVVNTTDFGGFLEAYNAL